MEEFVKSHEVNSFLADFSLLEPLHTAELYYIEGYANTYLYKIHI